MNIGFSGFGENVITFEADPTLDTAGVAVTLTSQGKAKKAEADDTICGYAVNLRSDLCGVQVKGYVCMAQDGGVTPGVRKLSVDDEGRVTLNENGREFLVVFADNESAGFIL